MRPIEDKLTLSISTKVPLFKLSVIRIYQKNEGTTTQHQVRKQSKDRNDSEKSAHSNREMAHIWAHVYGLSLTGQMRS